jgi:hypothetical protein
MALLRAKLMDDVKVGSTGWELRSTCPCCGQGGLVFSSCPKCHHVVLACAEVGTIFPDPRDLSRTLRPSAGAQCPSCGSASVVEFENATSEQIKALGFTPDQYE